MCKCSGPIATSRRQSSCISLSNTDKRCSSICSRGCVADFTECQIKALELCKSASRGDFEHVQFRPLKKPLRGFDAHACNLIMWRVTELRSKLAFKPASSHRHVAQDICHRTGVAGMFPDETDRVGEI